MYGILLYLGAIFVRDYGLTLNDMLIALFSIRCAAMASINA